MPSQTIQQALSQGELYTDNLSYRYLKLPLASVSKAANVASMEKSNPFLAFMVDKDEVTMMLTTKGYESNKGQLGDHEAGETLYRLITFDIVLEPTLIGFMAEISGALAKISVSILPFAGYSRDHLFVAQADFDKAMSVLQELKKKSQKEEPQQQPRI
jgi:hypothetical protein